MGAERSEVPVRHTKIIKNIIKNNSYSICLKGFFTRVACGSKILIGNRRYNFTCP
jgi:hypothetical protein